MIPPSLSIDNQDAGVNSPPAILAVRSDVSGELAEPGPVVFDRGTGTMTADLIDTDFADTLYVRVFVDYRVDHVTAPRAECKAPLNGKADRTIVCGMSAVCLPEDVSPTLLNMSIVVFDREPLDIGDPMFQAMPPGGLLTRRFYFLKCEEPL